MTSKLSIIILTQCLISKAMSSYMQPYSAKQYGGAYRQGLQKPSYPAPNYSSDYKAYYSQNYPSPSHSYPTNYYSSYPKIPEIPPVAAPIPVRQSQEIIRQNPVIDPKLLTTQAPAPTLDALKKNTGKIDSHVLNNIAIALQLLIVNNILNNPPETLETLPLSESIMEIAFPNGKYTRGMDTLQMPNSKFLGSSGFGQDLISSSMLGSYGLPSNPIALRPGLNLMSPYDAIAKSSPITESLISSFITKSDFQSPYAAIMAADSSKDLFSMSDLF